jgi:hypothetical protein
MAKPDMARNSIQARQSTTRAQSRMPTASSVISATKTRTWPTSSTNFGVTMQESVKPIV